MICMQYDLHAVLKVMVWYHGVVFMIKRMLCAVPSGIVEQSNFSAIVEMVMVVGVW